MVIGRAKTKCVSGETVGLPGESDKHQFFMLRIWFYIYQASTNPIFTRKGAKITEI